MHLVAPPFTWEFRAGRKARAEHDVSSWAEREVATTEPPPLRSLLHQVGNGMRVTVDWSGIRKLNAPPTFKTFASFDNIERFHLVTPF